MLELAVLFIVIGLVLVLLAALVPPVPAVVMSVGWALFALGAIVLVVVLLLEGLDVDLGEGRAD